MGVTRRCLVTAGAAALSGCSATAALNALVPRGTYRLEGDIAYGTSERQRLDVYLPVEAAAGAPVLVFFYGGHWTRGSRSDYRFVGEALASAGVVTVVPDYRLSPQVHWADILRDCAAATRWAVSAARRLGASPERVFLMGHSAGGYNAGMLALDPRWLRERDLQPRNLAGWIGLAGAYDFLPIRDPDVQRAFGWPATPADSQPLAHASARAPRTLLLTARQDDTVDPVRNSASLADRLQRAGAEARLQMFDGVGHVSLVAAIASPLRHLAPVQPEVLRFVQAG